MILGRFCLFPPQLWITLWVSRSEQAETLAPSRFPTPCPLSRQSRESNEINDLALLCHWAMMRRNISQCAL